MTTGRLPTASEMNQLAHPGGGTIVVENSREGLVEDLFETHLRHLDVATRSAVAARLVASADRLDAFGVPDASRAIDCLLVRTAEGDGAGPATTLFSRTVNKVMAQADVVNRIINSVSIDDVENYAAGKRLESLKLINGELSQLLKQADYTRAALVSNKLLSELTSMSASDLAESLGGGDSLWGYLFQDKYRQASLLRSAARTLHDELGAIAMEESEPVSLTKKVPVDTLRSNYSDVVTSMYNRFVEADKRTEDWKRFGKDPAVVRQATEELYRIPSLANGTLERVLAEEYKNLQDTIEKASDERIRSLMISLGQLDGPLKNIEEIVGRVQ